MVRHMVVLQIVTIFLISRNVWSLESENIIGENENRQPDIRKHGYHVTILRVVVENSQRKTSICGGTIIADHYAVTAAHCLRKKEFPKGLYVVLPNQVLDLKSPLAVWNYLEVIEAIVDKDYDFSKAGTDESIAHDIGLVRIKETFTKDRFDATKQLKYANEGENYGGTVGRVLGRGYNKLGQDDKKQASMTHGTSDFLLRYTFYAIFTDEKSKELLSYLNCDKDYKMCGECADQKTPIGLLGHGDSGGGLVSELDMLFGVLSSSSIYTPGIPTLSYFAPISHHRKLIDEMMTGLPNKDKYIRQPFTYQY